MITFAAEPLFEPDWAARHLGELGAAFVQHVELTVIAVAVGLAISAPLGIFAHRRRWALAPIIWVTGAFYTIPSLALFAFLAPYTGLTTLTAEIGLVGYTLLVLIRNIVAGLDAVPADTVEAAVAMGYSPRRLLWGVQIPLAFPVIFAGIRVAFVTTVGLVTVTALIGKGGLGEFILTGLDRFFSTPIILGAGLSVLLALTAETAFIAAERRLTPWLAGREGPA